MQNWAAPGAGGVLQNMNKVENTKGQTFTAAYPQTKLTTMYCAREIMKRAVEPDGR